MPVPLVSQPSQPPPFLRRCSCVARRAFEKLQYSPVENVIVLESFANKEVPEGFAEVSITRLVPKAKRVDVMEIACKFFGKPITEFLDTRRPFLPQYKLIFLLLPWTLKPLPRERTANEVYEKVSK